MSSNRKANFISSIISAKEISIGDRLDTAGKVRVHAVRRIGDKVAVGTRTRGSGRGGFASWSPDEKVKVYRKQ